MSGWIKTEKLWYEYAYKRICKFWIQREKKMKKGDDIELLSDSDENSDNNKEERIESDSEEEIPDEMFSFQMNHHSKN